MQNVPNSQSYLCLRAASRAKAASVSSLSLPVFLQTQSLLFSNSQRKVLQAELDKKDAIIASYAQILKRYMLHLHSGSDNNPSSGSPPSSAAYEEPFRKQVIEWLDKAGASKVSSSSYNLESRAFHSSPSDDHERPADKLSNASSLSRPPMQQQHSHGYSVSSGVSGNYIDLGRSRSRSPRVTRNSAIANHPVGFLARSALRGSGMGSRPSSIGEPVNSPTSSAEIGVARHDYFVPDSMALRASQLGLRRIEIDRGFSEEPKLLRKGLIVLDEVDKLFEIFYDKLNVSSFSHSGVRDSHFLLGCCQHAGSCPPYSGYYLRPMPTSLHGRLRRCFPILHGAPGAVQHCDALCNDIGRFLLDGEQEERGALSSIFTPLRLASAFTQI
jgi:hypothetical protein